MSDLISRSALIKHLTDWRLQECPVGICDEETETYKTICECIKAVKEQPTAYDTEKVVAELEEAKMIYFLTIANTGDEKHDFAYCEVANALNRAIDIVKRGGVE